VILAELDVQRRLEQVTHLANNEVNVLEISSQIQSATKQELDKGQREYILRQQLREIQKSWAKVMTARRKSKICDASSKKRHDEEARRAADRELERLRPNAAAAAEYSVVRQLFSITSSHSVEQAHRRQP
jgi:ATP-dependent Lon protease